jgi:hypothetical protein
VVARREGSAGPFAPVATIDGAATSYVDRGDGVVDGIAYQYQVSALPEDPALVSAASALAASRPSWFDTTKVNVFVVLSLFFVCLFA